ncbi:MAG: YbhB/YbcL family Raf kinase inhibitor-like protein [Steroidobacteraceae bacterium]
MPNRSTTLLCAASFLLLGACSPPEIHQPIGATLQVRSTTIADGIIPDKCGCKGPGISPEVEWSDPPAGTKSIAIIMDDQAISGHLHRKHFVHWVAFDLKPDRRQFAEGASQSLNAGELAGKNDVGQFGYSGPCPDAGTTHHYTISVYALDSTLGLPTATNGRQLMTAIDGHILARGTLVGAYTH